MAVPCGFAFLSSFCVMLVELVAGRMLSQYVGASLYTWTSVIGVVLGGITIGNLIGGRLADRFPPKTTLSVLFFTAGALCLAIPYLNHEIAVLSAWDRVNLASWPLRVATQVVLVFLAPSTALGLIGPVVAKWALDQGHAQGRTVGHVYAWGAIGSICGTFATGFLLVALLGASGVTFAAGAVLVLCGVLLAPAAVLPLLAVAWPLLVGTVLAHFLSTEGRYREWHWSGGRPVVRVSSTPGLRYEDESQYSRITVIEQGATGNLQLFLDNLVHAEYNPRSATRMEYAYEKIYAAITHRYGDAREDLQALFIGGGGYMFPRYIHAHWPESRIQVAEIDPAVTRACLEAFDLPRGHVRLLDRYDPDIGPQKALPDPDGPHYAPGLLRMDVYHLDARNHVEDLIRARRSGKGPPPFDFVYGDAFNDYSVPFHLVTREFALHIRELLHPQRGIYLLNVIEIYNSGRFLGAIYNTLHDVFPAVYIFCTAPNGPNLGPNGRDTFVVVSALQALDLTDLGKRGEEPSWMGALLKKHHLEELSRKADGIILTDDYSPVENLLEEVVRRRARK
jgi:spermidine synthase